MDAVKITFNEFKEEFIEKFSNGYEGKFFNSISSAKKITGYSFSENVGFAIELLNNPDEKRQYLVEDYKNASDFFRLETMLGIKFVIITRNRDSTEDSTSIIDLKKP